MLILVPIGIGILIYVLIAKYSKKTYANYFAIVYSILLVFLSVQLIFEDELFSKNDALELVQELNIHLEDDFKIIDNESFTAIGDYYHTFELEISQKDKMEAIKSIRNSRNFKANGMNVIDYVYSAEVDRFEGEKQIQNYENKFGYIREYFKPNGKGFAPTFRRIIIDKKENKLTFEDIDE